MNRVKEELKRKVVKNMVRSLVDLSFLLAPISGIARCALEVQAEGACDLFDIEFEPKPSPEVINAQFDYNKKIKADLEKKLKRAIEALEYVIQESEHGCNYNIEARQALREIDAGN